MSAQEVHMGKESHLIPRTEIRGSRSDGCINDYEDQGTLSMLGRLHREGAEPHARRSSMEETPSIIY